jgi:hypothetical protein
MFPRGFAALVDGVSLVRGWPRGRRDPYDLMILVLPTRSSSSFNGGSQRIASHRPSSLELSIWAAKQGVSSRSDELIAGHTSAGDASTELSVISVERRRLKCRSSQSRKLPYSTVAWHQKLTGECFALLCDGVYCLFHVGTTYHERRLWSEPDRLDRTL